MVRNSRNPLWIMYRGAPNGGSIDPDFDSDNGFLSSLRAEVARTGLISPVPAVRSSFDNGDYLHTSSISLKSGGKQS